MSRADLNERALRYFLLAACLVALLAVTACGGGDADDDEPTQPTPRVDCVAHPEQCK